MEQTTWKQTAPRQREIFNHKIGLCKKEAKETMHWLRMIAKARPVVKDKCRKLWKEARELTLIFSSILQEKNREKKAQKEK